MLHGYINFFDNKNNIVIYLLIMVIPCLLSMFAMMIQGQGSKKYISKTINIIVGLVLVMLLILLPYLFYMLKVISGLFPATIAVLLFAIYLVMVSIKCYSVYHKNQ